MASELYSIEQRSNLPLATVLGTNKRSRLSNYLTEDAEFLPESKRSKTSDEDPFEMLPMDCFEYVMSYLGERGLTMCVFFLFLVDFFLHDFFCKASNYVVSKNSIGL